MILNIATVFSGIGAPEYAAMRIYNNINIVFACEIDKFARKSYFKNHKIDMKCFYKDVKALNAKQYKGKVDLLVGGSPCQDFSIAGKGLGFKGFRGSLTGEFLRIIKECRPTNFIFENVPGIKRVKFKVGLNLFLSELRELGYYLHIEYANTRDYGIPQNRKRYFVVGFRNSKDYYNFKFAAKVELNKKIRDILEKDVDFKYYLDTKTINTFSKKNASLAITNINPSGAGMNGLVFDIKNIAPTLTTNKGEGIKIAGLLNNNGLEQNRRVYDTGGVSPTITTMQGGGQEIKILQRSIPEPLIVVSRGRCLNNPSSRRKGAKTAQRLEVNKKGWSNTITTVQKDNYIAIPDIKKGIIIIDNFYYWIRKLTPRECLRLQDFPDSFKIVVSDSQMYKQIGNSMSVNVLEMIIKNIKHAGEQQNEQGLLNG